jgi:cytochrome c-type protein NapC
MHQNALGKPEPTRNKFAFWQWLWRPSKRWYLLCLPVGAAVAFVVGILFMGGFNTAMGSFETLGFCTSCHEMSTPYQEYTQSVHYKNAAGIRAVCADCHVPQGFWPRLWRHAQASTEVWDHMLGTISSPEKYEAHRLELAQAVWTELKSNNSAECRRCHSYSAMALELQGHSAAKKHDPEYLARTGMTCIDCHKGVAHKLPDNL